MAAPTPQLGKTGKYGDLKKRLIFLLLALVVFRIGAHIPLPGIDRSGSRAVPVPQGGILGLFNMFSGGALSRFTIFALGIHALHLGLDHHAADDRRIAAARAAKKKVRRAAKITQYTRYGTVSSRSFRRSASP